MSKPKNGRALLVELLIVLFFFGLCTAIVLNSMIAVRTAASRASIKREALRCAQEDVAFMMGKESCEAGLIARGYEPIGDAWQIEREGISYHLELQEEKGKAGTLIRAQLTVYDADEMLLELPCSRYMSDGRDEA